jgi:hypothetical protein
MFALGKTTTAEVKPSKAEIASSMSVVGGGTEVTNPALQDWV